MNEVLKNWSNQNWEHRKLFREWFWSYLEVTNKFFESLKLAFFTFLQVFKRRRWNSFLEKRGKVLKNVYIQTWPLEAFRKMVSKLPWVDKRMFGTVENDIFQFFPNFWVIKLKIFSGKARQSVKNCSNHNFFIRSFYKYKFWSYLGVRNKCSEQKFLEKWGKVLKFI